MRPPRVAILVLFFAASALLVCRSISSIRRQSPAATPATAQSSPFRSLFSFTAPFSLFPPSAAISLTDDNSTFFPARPAAFGPPLPANGLSGQLWIGSGFPDESLQEVEGEGELGCSDIPGWKDRRSKQATEFASLASGSSISAPFPVDNSPENGLVDQETDMSGRSRGQERSVNDGTDDHLHRGLLRDPASDRRAPSGSGRADIQSIQESAEITGKIVLLSRGGCGFLEKVKWAQRRGAIALIVGDNQKGGPLIQMFARGNVDNVTIPSVFTSRTTARLLSSLVQPGSFTEKTVDEHGNPRLRVQQSARTGQGKNPKSASFSACRQEASSAPASVPENKSTKPDDVGRKRWISALIFGQDSRDITSDRSRPPSSGRLDWVPVDDENNEDAKLVKSGRDRASQGGVESNLAPSGSDATAEDGVQIGVQDCCDRDPVESPAAERRFVSSRQPEESAKVDGQSTNAGSAVRHSGNSTNGQSAENGGQEGASITPRSGAYAPGTARDSGILRPGKTDLSPGPPGGFISRIFGGRDGDQDETGFASAEAAKSRRNSPTRVTPVADSNNAGEGLWVTITPTGSASPFFDTLLVLVVSPLITLTVVYALLILRVKIRMRRWRAPKSVVDRLPVRTYHTISPSRPQSPKAPTPTSSSPTTPLLQGSSRSRTRSRTSTGAPESGNSPGMDRALEVSRCTSHEKNSRRVSSEWKRYMGRQVECVVCLEQYVDGVSRVMSLPCGHEFHAECM